MLMVNLISVPSHNMINNLERTTYGWTTASTHCDKHASFACCCTQNVSFTNLSFIGPHYTTPVSYCSQIILAHYRCVTLCASVSNCFCEVPWSKCLLHEVPFIMFSRKQVGTNLHSLTTAIVLSVLEPIFLTRHDNCF